MYSVVDKVLQEAMAFYKTGQIDETERICQEILHSDPDSVDALHLLGVVAYQVGKYDVAVDLIAQAIEIDSGQAIFFNSLGLGLKGQLRLEEAVEAYRRALEINPDYSEACNNLGTVLQRQEDFEQAIALYRHAVTINPKYCEAYNILGLLFQEQGRLKEGIEAYKCALKIHPQFANAHSNLAKTLFLQGDFRNAWKEYEWRWECRGISFSLNKRHFPQPLWDGSNLSRRTILVWAEQGIGDEIMFSSMLPTLLQIDVRVIVECTLRLIPLFQRAFPGVQFIPRENPVNRQLLDMAIDCQIPMLSLGKWLRPSAESFPSEQESYLFSCVEKTKRLRQKYQLLAGSRLLVGISWKSTGSDRRRSRSKSTALEAWTSILSRQDCFFLNLQYGDVKREIEEFKSKTDLRIYYDEEIDPLKNLDDFAAQVSALDLIISTSNTTVHIAGGLGKIVWTLLPNPPDWKWMLEGKDSVWYPAMRLFRQDKIGDWSGVFRSVALELDIFCRGMVSDESP